MSLVSNLQYRESVRPEATVVLPVCLARQTVDALSDEFSKRILLSTVPQGKTIQEISMEQAVPLSTCYRRARELVDEGLLVIERVVVTGEGKRYAVYRSAFKSVEMSSDFSETTLSAELNQDVADKVRAKWFRICEGNGLS